MIEEEKREPLKFRFDSNVSIRESYNKYDKQWLFTHRKLVNISLSVCLVFLSIKTIPHLLNNDIKTNQQQEISDMTYLQQVYAKQITTDLLSADFINNLDNKKDLFTQEAFDNFKNYTMNSKFYADLKESKQKSLDIKMKSPAYVDMRVINGKEYYTYYIPSTAYFNMGSGVPYHIYSINQTVTLTKDDNTLDKFIISNVLIEDKL